MWQEKCKSLWFPLEGEVALLPFRLSGVDGSSPKEAEMRSSEGAFCSVWFCLSVMLIIARNSCLSEVLTCHLFLVIARKMSEAMFEY